MQNRPRVEERFSIDLTSKIETFQLQARARGYLVRKLYKRKREVSETFARKTPPQFKNIPAILGRQKFSNLSLSFYFLKKEGNKNWAESLPEKLRAQSHRSSTTRRSLQWQKKNNHLPSKEWNVRVFGK